ncbi:NAD+ synthase [Pararhodobacter oceanensis]|uniref:NAD+ synthase n=1 Tax=Pararhodobacter oceanensis TaxID=2172121 RepID=UPI003A8CAAEC
MSQTFRLTLAQLNPTVGALRANADLAREAWREARAAKADMIAFPEMFLTGYQTQDLVQKPAFARDAMAVIAELAADCAEGPAIGIGAPHLDGELLFNAYYVLQEGRISAVVKKHTLPNYMVFDEKRLFTAADISGPYRVGPLVIGSPICEDAWFDEVPEAQAESGAQILLVPNGSPYSRGRHDTRIDHMVARVIETGLPLVYVNLIGGQDDQVFDGSSFVLNARGHMTHLLPGFTQAIAHVDFTEGDDGWQVTPGDLAPMPEDYERDYHAMVTGTRDYLQKSGFQRVLLGLSGGIDSALVAAIAADALGPENVHCIMLPSEYTSEHSLEDAEQVAQALGVKLDEIAISGPRAAVTQALAPLFDGLPEDLTEENIQSRLRGVLLMAVSNKLGAMVLTTGNKSEVAVGYATIYGDMNGGFNPIKDLYKTRVFETCRWRNANYRDWMKAPEGEVIPVRVIDKPPSAELRADQKDEDSLPPYEVLDVILEGLLDRDLSVAELVAERLDRETVKRIEHLIYISEWKRYQAAPGVRLSTRALHLDRRYPMVNRWRDPS